MSSYICNPLHFNSVERSLIELHLSPKFYEPYSLQKAGFKHLYGKKDYNGIISEVKETINTLRDLNVVCFFLQYKHHYKDINHEIEQEKTYLNKNRKQSRQLSKHGLFNALRCIRYQIETEHLKELRPLTEEEQRSLFYLDEMANCIAAHILDEMPEDQTCAWSVKE